MTSAIRKILIANRGEIAVRIMRTCRDLGIRTVAVFSDPDRSALHVQHADEAWALEGTKASETYLNQPRILEIAKSASVDAIHPGYGFLSENEQFAEAVEKCGIRFIGPPAGAIRSLGDKTAARALARKLGLPTVRGTEALQDASRARSAAGEIGFPLLIKAAAGGGGKGMRIVRTEDDFSSAFAMAQSEAKNAFGDDRVFLEQYIERPHHVEIQVLADGHGNVIHLGERDCSIQRRHQKVIEETPSPWITPETRDAMGEAAANLVREAGYTNAGTVEFLVDATGRYYFLEVNTRLQVEHPVTEAVTGVDLVREQISIAEGHHLGLGQRDVRFNGHAIECRVYAEDPFNSFFPSTGTLSCFAPPGGPRVRVDSGARTGDRIGIHYDPMLAKVIAWGNTRQTAIETMKRALREFTIVGVQTTNSFCLAVLDSKEFLEGKHSTQFIDKDFDFRSLQDSSGSDREVAALAAVLLAEARRPAVGAKENGETDSKWRSRREEMYRS